MSEIQQTISGLMTGLLLILFVGICLWSWSSKRKETFEQMANVPLEDKAPNIDKFHINQHSKAQNEISEASL